MKTLARACKLRDSIFDAARRDTVLDLSDLVQDRIDPAAFFRENHVTEGMRILLTEGFLRLEGKTTQGVFKLTQAMGGGKTHNLQDLGLLAKHPQYRRPVMEGFYTPGETGPVRVVAFSGRDSDAPLGIWGAIANQLGKREQFADYYSPLSAPGQTAWVNLLKGDPLVITDLTAAYAGGSQQIIQALNDLDKETGRTVMSLEPVRRGAREILQRAIEAEVEWRIRADPALNTAPTSPASARCRSRRSAPGSCSTVHRARAVSAGRPRARDRSAA